MEIRRVGEATVEARVRGIVEDLAGQRGPLLEVLHRVQAELGHLPADIVPVVADALNLSRAEVHGVISFYKDLRQEPPARLRLQLCRAEACQANGCEAVVERVRDRTGLEVGERSPDGALEVDEVFCLGLCGNGPAARVGDRILAGLDTDGVDVLLDDLLGGSATVLLPHPVTPALGREAAAEVTVYVPGDTAAVALGADDVAEAILAEAAERATAVRVVRTGSRGMLWLEPLVEVDSPGGRLAYGPVAPADVPALVGAGLLDAEPPRTDGHPLALGPTDDLPWMRDQQRLTFARVGVVDPRSADDYLAHGGTLGLQRALERTPAEVVAEVTESGLRGRGGAGFPTGIKWTTVLDTPGELKFICANADEGDSGTFADRMLMEGDPFTLVEGMAIAAHAVGATEGYVYVRSEYPAAIDALRHAIEVAYARGWLGQGILGSDLCFDLSVRVGAGAYICGEETSMLESLEGRRGEIRPKPPLPAVEGLFGRPTVVNNVLTLATVPWILAHGADRYAELGVERSRGTQVFQLAGNLARPGVVETAFGVTVGDLIERWGGGTRTGRPLRAVQVGGPLGAYLPTDQLELPMDYEALAAARAMLGHGGLVAFDDTVDLATQARFAMRFCAEESCGKCTPCRVGSVRGVEVIDRIVADEDRDANLVLLEDLCEIMEDASLCAMGGLTPMPVRSALRHFPDDFDRRADAPAP